MLGEVPKALRLTVVDGWHRSKAHHGTEERGAIRTSRTTTTHAALRRVSALAPHPRPARDFGLRGVL